MALELNGTTGVSLVQDGVVTAADLASGAITSAALPTDSILQVLTSVKSAEQLVQSTSYTTITNLSTNITPSSTSSRILILVNLNLDVYQNSNAPSNYLKRLTRNGTEIVSKNTDHYAGTASNGYRSLDGDGTMMFIDSPSTTSLVSYAVQLRLTDTSSSRTARVSNGGADSTMIVMELAG